MSSATTWLLQQGRAELRSVDCRGVVHVPRLAQGVTEIQRPAGPLPGAQLLGVEVPGYPDPLPAPWILDQYVRRNDLIATYERTAPEPLRTQVYWRYVWEHADEARAGGGRVEGLHLIVSLQTDRLDLRPTVAVVSHLPSQQLLCLETPEGTRLAAVPRDDVGHIADHHARAQSPLWLIRAPGETASVALMTLPQDLVRVVIQWDDVGVRCAFQLLDEHLEKGVIRRAQAAAWFVPRETDQVWAVQLFRQMVLAAPPLTT